MGVLPRGERNPAGGGQGAHARPGRPVTVDRQALHDEMNQAYAIFHQMTEEASPSDLRRRSIGTRWTNQQLLFHMVFGYLVVLRLLRLVHLFGRLPDGAS